MARCKPIGNHAGTCGMKNGLFNTFFNPSTGSQFSSRYQAILDRASSLLYSAPSQSVKVKGDTFMQALDTAGLLAKALCGKMFKTDGDSNFATLDWVNPSIRQASKVNAPTFSADGYNSNGTTSYLMSGMNLSDITQTSVTYCAKGFVNTGVNSRSIFGAANDGAFGSASGGLILQPRNASDSLQYRCSSQTVSTAASTDATRRFAISRSAGVQYISINGAAFVSDTVITSAVSTPKEIALLAVNGTSVHGFNVGGISYFWVFNGKLSDVEISAFDTAMVNYLS